VALSQCGAALVQLWSAVQATHVPDGRSQNGVAPLHAAFEVQPGPLSALFEEPSPEPPSPPAPPSFPFKPLPGVDLHPRGDESTATKSPTTKACPIEQQRMGGPS
jgi:hypothetical protein